MAGSPLLLATSYCYCSGPAGRCCAGASAVPHPLRSSTVISPVLPTYRVELDKGEENVRAQRDTRARRLVG